MTRPIVAHEADAPVFLSQPPQERAFRVILSPHLQHRAPTDVSVSTADVYPGQSTPCHTHICEHEVWYVLEGSGLVVVGEEQVTATAGTVVVAPPGIPHQLVNTSPTEHFKCLVIFSPAGPEGLFLPEDEPFELGEDVTPLAAAKTSNRASGTTKVTVQGRESGEGEPQ